MQKNLSRKEEEEEEEEEEDDSREGGDESSDDEEDYDYGFQLDDEEDDDDYEIDVSGMNVSADILRLLGKSDEEIAAAEAAEKSDWKPPTLTGLAHSKAIVENYNDVALVKDKPKPVPVTSAPVTSAAVNSAVAAGKSTATSTPPTSSATPQKETAKTATTAATAAAGGGGGGSGGGGATVVVAKDGTTTSPFKYSPTSSLSPKSKLKLSVSNLQRLDAANPPKKGTTFVISKRAADRDKNDDDDDDDDGGGDEGGSEESWDEASLYSWSDVDSDTEFEVESACNVSPNLLRLLGMESEAVVSQEENQTSIGGWVAPKIFGLNNSPVVTLPTVNLRMDRAPTLKRIAEDEDDAAEEEEEGSMGAGAGAGAGAGGDGRSKGGRKGEPKDKSEETDDGSDWSSDSDYDYQEVDDEEYFNTFLFKTNMSANLLALLGRKPDTNSTAHRRTSWKAPITPGLGNSTRLIDQATAKRSLSGKVAKER